MNIVIYDAAAYKEPDGKWRIKYTILHNDVDDNKRGMLFHLAHIQIEKYLEVKFESEIVVYPYPPNYYVPKNEAEEVQFILKFPTLNNMSFEI
jgi:hypothetical protein